IAALAGWVLVQVFATAYARGAGGGYPAPRYLDTLVCGVVANALALGWLLSRHAPPRGWNAVFATLALVWVGVLAFGLRDATVRTLRDDLANRRTTAREIENHLRGFLATDDPAQLAFPEVPYFSDGLIERLSHRPLRASMPVSVRPPLALRPGSMVRPVFSENHASQLHLATAPRSGVSPATAPLASHPTWGSFTADGASATGEWSSAPLTAPLGGWLKFETAGHLGEPGVSLELHDARTGALLAPVRPSRVPHDTWRAAYVRAPRGPFFVVARDVDPHRWFAFSAPVEMGAMSYWAWQAAKHGLLLVQIAGAGILLGCFVWLVPHVARAARALTRQKPSRPSTVDENPRLRPSLRASLGLAFCLFLAVWGTKLAVVDRFATDLPFWDQWAKEGEFALIPWLEHGELREYLFLPHNEHRIAPTLALNLGLVLLGGQWDARVQCVASAAIHGSIAALLFLWALRRLSRSWALACGALVMAVMAPPIAWENVVSGFQSQFYFLILFSGLALHGLLNARAFSVGWLIGLAAGAVALVSMGSGLLCAVSIAAIAFARLLRAGPAWRDPLATLLAAVALGVSGVWLRTPTPWHEPLHAHTVHDFLLYLVRCLAWPCPRFPVFAALVWAPWLVLLAIRLREFRRVDAKRADFILAVGGWVLLQIAAVAYSRGAGRGMPSSRYGDVSALGSVLSFCALALLPLSTRPRTVIGAALIAMIAAATIFATDDVWKHDLPARKTEYVAFERSVREFVLTDNYAAFEKSPLPFPSPEWLARILRHESIRTILPGSVRAPPASGGATWVSTLSLRAAQLAARGWWLAAAGGAGAVALAIALLRTREGLSRHPRLNQTGGSA
ncbi:MAG: hypothetical protein ABIZ49_08830, partial [Opitutaceae bacterium]